MVCTVDIGRYRGAMVVFLSLMGATVEVWTISSMELSVLVSSGRGQRERQRQTKTIWQGNTYTYFRIPVTPFLASFRWVER